MNIATKVTLWVSLIAGLLLTATGYVQLLLQEQKTKTQIEQQAKITGDLIKATAEVSLQNFGRLGLITDLIANRNTASVTFFGADARAIAPVPIEENPMVNPRIDWVIKKNKTEDEFIEENNRTIHVLRIPLLDGDAVAGALELRTNVTSALASQHSNFAFIISGVFLVLFALAVGLFLRRTVDRPIARLMDGMDHVIRGDLTHALPMDQSDEIGRIAYRFNEMTAQLRAAENELQLSSQARLKLEQRLSKSEKLATVGQLSAEIAHEVGSPLNVIVGRALALNRKAQQPEEVIKNAQIIGDQATRITKIIQQMLDLARARVPQKAPVNLINELETALTFLEYQIQQSNIKVIRKFADDLPTIHGDPDALQQVILNLLLNAIQAMPQGGELIVGTYTKQRRKEGLDLAPPQQFVAIIVQDSGKGIPEESKKKIFEPFYSTKERGEGTGLGLTVVMGIVKEHDGWIEVSDVQPHGTCFRVYLPVQETDAIDQVTND